MKKRMILTGLLLMALGSLVHQSYAQVQNTPSAIFKYNKTQNVLPDAGYLVAGDLWASLQPMNSTYTGLNSSWQSQGVMNYIMLGSPGNWKSPTGDWPSSYTLVGTWRSSPAIMFPMYEAGGWPGYNSANPLRGLDGGSDNTGANGTSRFMYAMYGNNVPGVNDPARNYVIPAQFTDKTRTTLVYQAGWPTTAGVDMQVRAIEFTPNTQNLNDFVLLEVSMTNTGVVDSNNDGTPDATNNVIDGITMTEDLLATYTVLIGTGGDRGANLFGCGRTFGYIASPDENGDPYNVYVWYPNVPDNEVGGTQNPINKGARHFGILDYPRHAGYDDIWNGVTWIGVKQGAISKLPDSGPYTAAQLNDVKYTDADKTTLFGSDPIGKGSQRGWYTSVQWQGALGASRGNAQLDFYNNIATWYQDYGKTSSVLSGSGAVDLSPNSNYFASGTADKIETWVPLASPGRPNGDFKYASSDLGESIGLEEPIFEPDWNQTLQAFVSNPESAPGNQFYHGTGFTRDYTFGEAMDPGIGPFKLDVGQSLTFVWVYAAGFRFPGLWNAIKAAKWAWQNGWDIETPLQVPAAPEMEVQSTPDGTAMVRWTDVSDPSISPHGVDGYKIWKASQYKRTKYLDEGMRAVNRYQQQQDPTASNTPFLDPINPFYDDTAFFSGGTNYGTYQPAGWGTYQLIANIPSGSLSNYADASHTDGYDFQYEDKTALTGFTYWYYVSAYKNGTFTGPQGTVGGGHTESSNFNRNGRNSPGAATGTIGLMSPWGGTYPFANRAAEYPAVGTLAYKNLGADFTVTPPVAAPDQVKKLITVTPNPYKITGLNDVRTNPSSHNLYFLNLPKNYTLTIIDVSGKIIYQTHVTNAANGQYVWDMFSKDGVEVASGLYIYHVSWNVNGQTGDYTGHFAILR